MTPQDQEAMWRNRFIAMNLLRIGATVGVLASLVLWQSDIFVEGGSIVGFPLALIFLVVSFWGPKWLARRWREPPTP
ncbi:hypothetical protein [Sphingosinicella sp. CPCC 101087]|uniref:hypothetical protein n=1 Tax=Sphingosinicella sp. CPCC 101087 TaxID=2497754 RepID=UPI00101CEFFC|nr:hypothetical protein [Sphingosinicella sp. CPCC 101087]